LIRWRRKPQAIAGVEIRERQDAQGPYWIFRVRWKDPATGARVVETLDSPQEALDFRAQLRLLRRRGELVDLDRGRETLDVFVQEWFRDWASANVAPSTLRAYASIWNRHFLDRVGSLQLRHVTPKVVEDVKQDLLADRVGAPTVAKGMGMLQAVFRQALMWNRVAGNPVKEVAKPATPRKKVIEPLSVTETEALIAWMLEHRNPAEAMLCELLAYTGARPQDALALHWSHVGRQRVTYAYKVVDGKLRAGAKTGADKARDVELLAVVRADLLAYRMSAGAPRPNQLLFARRDAQPWTPSDYKNWQRADREDPKRRRSTRAGAFPRAMRAIGHPEATPYFLRHTYASLRLAEQRLSLQEIANELGHSLEVLSRSYAHVISDLRGQGPVNPEKLVREARHAARRPQDAPKAREHGAP